MAVTMMQCANLGQGASVGIALERRPYRHHHSFPSGGMQRSWIPPRTASMLSMRATQLVDERRPLLNRSRAVLAVAPSRSGISVKRGREFGLDRSDAGNSLLDSAESSCEQGRRPQKLRASWHGIGGGNNAFKRRRLRWLRPIRAAQTDSSSEDTNPALQKALEILHLGVSMVAFLSIDKFLKQQFAAAGIKFPSALFGMFCIFTLLNVADVTKPEVASAVIGFFQPGITFIQRWLPLFYVPSLVTVPLAIQGIPPAAAVKIALLFVAGWVASLAVAGYTTMAVRNIVKTEMQPTEETPKPAPFADWELKALVAAVVLFFGLAIYSPTALGSSAKTVAPFFIAATALGYVFGSNLPGGVKQVFHPIITCAVTADVAAFVYGKVSKVGFDEALNYYLTKQAQNPGAGDVYMGFLGSVILSFAFSMFKQRKLVKRHAAEIFTAVATAGIFSMYSTAIAGRLLGLQSDLTLAVVPRCITVALALPIAGLLEAGNPSVTAAVVVLTGLVGANFTQAVMDKLGLSDPISRGMATASSAHGLGTAALSAKEPEALPFCAIAYALTGIFCSVLVSVPAIQHSLRILAGA